ncbi:hypothetical protein AB0J57_32410 [Streptomyces sp. NPDC049837]|uniref:hypothetical protein n=1 Tax=Streptomyces sp. NPDC049837 TaxID=3155277 RepID=UPI00342F2AEE
MDKLIELAGTLFSGAVIAVLASWLTNRARNRQEQQAEVGALRVQADAMTVAVLKLQGAAAANRLLWEGPAERGRTFLLTVLAVAGGAVRARIAGGTDMQSGLVGFGRAAELLSRERMASKQTAAAIREPLTRAATAAAPLMRCRGYRHGAVAECPERLGGHRAPGGHPGGARSSCQRGHCAAVVVVGAACRAEELTVVALPSSSGFWHRSWGAVAERYLDVRLRGDRLV